MTAVGGPRGVLVAPFTRQLLHTLVTKRNRVELKAAIGLLRLVCDQPTIRRPIRIRPVVLVPRAVRRQPLHVRAVSVANIYLRVPEATRSERESSPVGTESCL